MPSPFIGGRIPQELHDHLQAHIDKSGEKLPKIIINALQAYLNLPASSESLLEERVSELEARLTALEAESVRAEEAPEEIEGLTHEEVAERTSYAISTLKVYHTKGISVSDGEYTYIASGKGKERLWIAQISNDSK